MARVTPTQEINIPYAWKYKGSVKDLGHHLLSLRKSIFEKIVEAYGAILKEMEKEPNFGLFLEDMKKKKIEINAHNFRKEMHNEARGFLALLTTKAFPHVEPFLTCGINVWIDELDVAYLAAFGPGGFFKDLQFEDCFEDFSTSKGQAERVEKWKELTSKDGWTKRMIYPVFNITELYLEELANAYDEKIPPFLPPSFM